MKYLFYFYCLFFFSPTFTQGLVHYSDDALDGYTLFNNDEAAFLIDNCGKIVNRWNSVFPKYHTKLTKEGNLIYIDWPTGRIIEKDWNDNVVKSTGENDNSILLDYEVIVLPNGNYLCLARKNWTSQDFIDIGYDINNGTHPNKVDVVVEIVPESGEIVWFWNIADHVTQERDPSAANYGSVSDNPQLLNLDAISTYDWVTEESFMINGMGYNALLDQIVLSVRKMGEIIVIDHSTTTQEAQGSTGGNSGKGGDIIYRWGNPANYGRGNNSDQYLYYQHSPNWVEHGPYQGYLTMYNNGLNRPGVSFEDRYSSVPIIAPPIDQNGNYFIEGTEAYAPTLPAVDISKVTTNTSFYSNYTSGAKVLPNENILITVGGETRIMEVDYDGLIKWEYIVPNTSLLFRSEKYPSSFEGFANKDLTSMGTVESPPSNVPCQLNSSTHPDFATNKIRAYVSGHKNITIDNPNELKISARILDLRGKLIKNKIELGLKEQIKLVGHPSGIYIIQITLLDSNQSQSLRVWLP